MIKLILIGVVVLFFIALIAIGYVKAPPDKAYIISGLGKKRRILIGKAGFKIPFFERLDKLSLGAIQIDVKTGQAVPTKEFINVTIDSNVNVKIGTSPEMLQLASENFLNVPRETINAKVRDLLEGNLREIAGATSLVEMVSDRKAFSEKVQENAVPDLARFGLELISFNVQNFSDKNGVIENLGIDNVEQIRKKAAIAKSDAQREIAIAEAENAKTANDAKVKAAEDIAIRNNDLAIKQAELKREADTKKAEADAALDIEAENQRKARDVAATNADIAKAEREAELKRQQIELRERELDALVRKQADADKYAAEKKAEADKIAAQNAADAELYAALKKAEGIAAVGKAEAEAIEMKAEAQKKMGEASVLEMVLSTMPQMVANAAAPLTNVDSITMYGEGNQNKLVGDVMKTTNQVMAGLAENGIDIKDMLNKFLTKNNNN